MRRFSHGRRESRRTSMQAGMIGLGRTPPVTARCRWSVALAGGEGGEERVEKLHDVGLSADHQAVAALEAPHTPARATVDVVEPACRNALRPLDVVPVVRVTSIDDHVPRRQIRYERFEGVVDRGGGHHEPHDARLGESARELAQRRAPDRSVGG